MPYKSREDRNRSNRESYQRNKESRLAKNKEWKVANREMIRAKGDYTTPESRAKARSNYRKPAGVTGHTHYRAHGLTLDDFEFLEKLQGFRCAGCRELFHTNTRVHVDHDHACGTNPHASCSGSCVRGLLCQDCNVMLGSYEKVRPWAETYLMSYA